MLKLQISSEALQACRVAVNKHLVKNIGEEAYHIEIWAHSFQGADLLSSGMRHSYGKPIGAAARDDIGQILVSVRSKDSFITVP
jgi:large subunit ribosomal protein L10e